MQGSCSTCHTQGFDSLKCNAERGEHGAGRDASAALSPRPRGAGAAEGLHGAQSRRPSRRGRLRARGGRAPPQPPPSLGSQALDPCPESLEIARLAVGLKAPQTQDSGSGTLDAAGEETANALVAPGSEPEATLLTPEGRAQCKAIKVETGRGGCSRRLLAIAPRPSLHLPHNMLRCNVTAVSCIHVAMYRNMLCCALQFHMQLNRGCVWMTLNASSF
jgi:hypothetical protein